MAPTFPHKIIFVRHGQTSYNAENRLQGQRDIPLDGLGREQAHAIGRFLGARMGAEMARLDAQGAFWASPLERARETMEIARAAMELPPQSYRLDPRLMELNFGDWQGLTWGQVRQTYPGQDKARDADKWRFSPPGGESYVDLVRRVGIWLDEQNGDRFVAAHGGVARAFLALLAGADPSVAANAEIFQGRALVFDGGASRWVG